MEVARSGSAQIADEGGGAAAVRPAAWATNPRVKDPPGAAWDVCDPAFGRLLLRSLGAPRRRFVGNCFVLRYGADGDPAAMLGPYWTMLVFVTWPLAVLGPSLAAALWCGRFHVGVRIAYGAVIAATALALISVSTRNPGLLRRRDAAPEGDVNWVWNDQAATYKPPGAIYCSWCDAVLLDFDHTCPWTGTGIARGNMTSFKAFVVCVQVLIYATIAIFVLGAIGVFPRR